MKKFKLLIIKSKFVIMSNKSCILIVDDDEPIRESFRDYFEMRKYEVVTAKDGHSAIKQFTEHSPDLVLMDFMMPGMNGHQTLQKIKKLNSDAKFVIVTAYDSTIPLSKNERKNIPIILKPVLFSQITDTVENMIKTDNKKNTDNSKMASVLIDDDLYDRLKNIQLDIIKKDNSSVSFSNIINNIIKEFFDNKENEIK